MDKDIKIKKFLLNEKVQKIIKSDDAALPNTPGGDQKNNGSDEYNTICRAFGRVLKAYIEESSAKKRMYIEFLPNASIRDERGNCLKALIENNTLLKMGAVKTEVLVTGDKKFTRYIREHELVDAGAVAVICDLTGEKTDLIFTVNGFLKQPAREQCQTLQNHALKRSEEPVPYYKAKFQAAKVMLCNVPYQNPDVDFVALQNIIERFLKKIPIKITYAKKHIDSESRKLNKNIFTINGETCNINWSTIVGRALLEGRAEKNHFHLAAVILSWVTYRTYNKKDKDKVDANGLLNDLLTSFEFESDEAKLQEIISRLSRGMVEEEQDKELISLIADDFKNIEARKSEVETKIKKRDGHITAQDLLLNDDRGAAQPKRYFNNRICHIQDIFSYDDIKNDINDIDPIASVSNILDDFSERIVQTVNKQPLMKFLQQQADQDENYIDEYRALTNMICRYKKSEDKFYVKPVASSLLNRIKKDIVDFCLTKDYSANEMICIISDFANQASLNKDYCFILNVYKITSDNNSHTISIVNDLRYLTIGGKPLILLASQSDVYKFSLKQYRLVFRALYDADNNMCVKFDSAYSEKLVENIVSNLLDQSNFNQIEVQNDYYPSHARLKFDSLIIYSYILLSEIDNHLFYSVIDKLFYVINDYSPQNRKKQEAAISIIAYLLSEDKWILPEYQKEMFFYAYSQSIYKNAADLWDVLPYKTIVEKAKSEALVLGKDNKFAQAPPYFIYYWNYLERKKLKPSVNSEDHTVLDAGLALQYQSWLSDESISDQDKVDIRNNIYNFLKKSIGDLTSMGYFDKAISGELAGNFTRIFPAANQELLEFVYGSNMLLMALANIERNSAHWDVNLISQTFDSKDNLKAFLKLVILTDYLTRRVNREYNERFHGSVTEQKNQMMLLCGATRVLAVNLIRKKLSNQTVDLNGEMQAYYNKWLSKESGRYKILLLRLLSFTNFVPQQSDSDLIADIKTVMEEESTKKNSVFMEYDNINASEILKHIGNNKSWKDCLRATEQ